MKRIKRKPATPKGPTIGEAVLDALAKMGPENVHRLKELSREERERLLAEAHKRLEWMFPDHKEGGRDATA